MTCLILAHQASENEKLLAQMENLAVLDDFFRALYLLHKIVFHSLHKGSRSFTFQLNFLPPFEHCGFNFKMLLFKHNDAKDHKRKCCRFM